MNTIENGYGISQIVIDKHLILYCPMGKDYYDADVNIVIIPADSIMDYCETDKFLKEMNGEGYIIEDAAETIFNHVNDGIKPNGLIVTIRAANGAHMPVSVSKRGGCLS